MLMTEEHKRQETVLSTAFRMMAAARTAPKGRGVDNLQIITVYGDDLVRLAEQMRDHGTRSELQFFFRDADNVAGAEAVVLIGTRIVPLGLNCGYCGFPTCGEKGMYPTVPCSFNTGDLGIAIGSAVSVAADNRIDNRTMYSVGKAALELGILEECCVAYGIVLSCTSKNPFFDRPANH